MKRGPALLVIATAAIAALPLALDSAAGARGVGWDIASPRAGQALRGEESVELKFRSLEANGERIDKIDYLRSLTLAVDGKQRETGFDTVYEADGELSQTTLAFNLITVEYSNGPHTLTVNDATTGRRRSVRVVFDNPIFNLSYPATIWLGGHEPEKCRVRAELKAEQPWSVEVRDDERVVWRTAGRSKRIDVTWDGMDRGRSPGLNAPYTILIRSLGKRRDEMRLTLNVLRR